MSEQAPLPTFKYHPDPIATGSVKPESDTPCLGCNRIRGYIYTGPVYTEKPYILDDHLCPWCIADGTAAKRFGASFNDSGTMEDVTPEIMTEIEERTPGFEAWQDPQWPTCCDDAAAFLGAAGAPEIRRDFPKAAATVKMHLRDDYDLSGDDLQEVFDSLTKDDQPTAYIFQCLHCERYHAFVDQT